MSAEGDVVSAIGIVIAASAAVVAAVGVRVALKQLRRNETTAKAQERTARAEFYLSLREMFYKHDDVHSKLRGGEWSNGKGPNDEKDKEARRKAWIQVESYMGLFELCNRMINWELLDREYFTTSYDYRIWNILANKQIVEAKLIEKRSSWPDFIQLCEKLGYRVPTDKRFLSDNPQDYKQNI